MNDTLLAGERLSGFETIRCNKEKNTVPVSISGAAYHDQNGSPMGIILNIRDISICWRRSD